MAYFPIIALGLITESFSVKITKEGMAVALKSVAATALVAVVIALIADINGVLLFLLDFPELLVAQIGMILFIAEYLDFRLLENYLFPKNQSDDSLDEERTRPVKVKHLVEKFTD